MRIPDFPLPETPAVQAALEVVTTFCTRSIANHSIRSWLWACGFAAVEGRDQFDAELLCVSALLHDIGLASEFDNHRLSYEHAGGHVAWTLTAGARWEVARRTRALEVIVRHNWPSVDPAKDVEGYLLEVATGFDILGTRLDALPDTFLREVLAEYPRLDLAREFGTSVENQAVRKPDTAAARLVTGGLTVKLANHPLEDLRA
ncbi:MAG: HD domain-containing protein [Nakamurella sp.]